MALIECEDAKDRFQKKLDSDFYKRDHSKNTEVVYAKEKQDRDTKEVEEFTKSQLFQSLYAGIKEP